MTDYRRIVEWSTIGVMLTDLIINGDGFNRLSWSVINPDRCMFCGYKFDHPIVIHVERGIYCGW